MLPTPTKPQNTSGGGGGDPYGNSGDEKHGDGDTEKHGKTATSSPDDYPNFTKTKIDVDDKDKDRREPRLPDPERPQTEPKPPDDDTDDDTDENTRKPMGGDDEPKTGWLRPQFLVGGQNILQLTEKEKLQEIKDYDLFDLPVPEGEDPDNPIYNLNNRQRNFRFYGNGSWRPPYMYKQPVRQYGVNKVERAKINSMRPVMRPSVGVPGVFQDPYDRRRFDTPTDAYKHSMGTLQDYADRSGNIYTDVAQVAVAPLPYRSRAVVSQIDLMLSLK
jgi:hypothetical protein